MSGATQNWLAAVAALERSPERIARSMRRARRFWRALLVIFGLAFAVFLVSSVLQLLAAWRSGAAQDWRDFWDSAVNLLRLSPFFILANRSTWEGLARSRERMVALRQAAIARDETLAPVAATQPSASDFTSGVIGPLRRPDGTRGTTALGTAITCFTIGGMSGFSAFILLFVYLGHPSSDLGVGLLVMTLLTVPLLWIGVVGVQRRRRWLRPLTVNVDDIGLSWREPVGRRPARSVLWHEAQAFVTLHWRDPNTLARSEVYALIGPQGAFMWQPGDRSAGEERTAHHLLAGTIVARTGLPLRDLTAGVAAVADEQGGARTARKPEIAFPLGTPGSPDAVPGLIPAIVTPGTVADGAASDSRKTRPGYIVAAVLLVPTVLLYGSGFVLQRYQPQYFGTLLSHIHAQRPLYRDSLAAPDGDWPNASAAQGPYYDGDLFTGESYLHSGGAYHVKGTDSDRFMDWLPGQTYGDAAVEVTAREIGTAPDDGVGLIVRLASDPFNDDVSHIVFYVDRTGDWWLWSYAYNHANSDDWSLLDGGERSDAVHAGSGATNTLLLVMRGNMFICYVNGHFVGSDTVDGVASSGQAGIYMNTSVTEGVFSNFAVYPLPHDIPLLV